MAMPPHAQTFLRKSLNDDPRIVRFAEIAKMAKAIVRIFQDVAKVDGLLKLTLIAN
jgi:hypothetical protein